MRAEATRDHSCARIDVLVWDEKRPRSIDLDPGFLDAYYHY